MSVGDSVFNNLRQKLDVFGYKQALPLAAVPLVGSLFEDLIKTTESLRDAKKKIVQLFEEKNCWELGVEPYKCDNTRLLNECNQMHLQTLRLQEDFERRACDYNQKIRCLQTDKFNLEEKCTQLQLELQNFTTKLTGNLGMGKDASLKNRKPFISTVRAGQELPPLKPLNEHVQSSRCSKCNAAGCVQRSNALNDQKIQNCQDKEIVKLQNNVKDLTEQLVLYKEKVSARDREIDRLNELLTGGRPPGAVARDCCYKKVGMLAQDIELLQREKSENLNKIRTYQDKMHEAMQRSIKLDAMNRQLRIDLEEIKKAALKIEQQANADARKRDREIEKLKLENKRLQQKVEKYEVGPAPGPGTGRLHKQRNQIDSNLEKIKSLETEQMQNAAEKRRLTEQLNTITQREIELQSSNQILNQKLHKLKRKLMSMRKELKEKVEKQNSHRWDEENIRLKSEREFFQKEYLRLLGRTGSEKEVEFLQEQIKAKDEELRTLRTELCMRDDLHIPITENLTPHQPPTRTASPTFRIFPTEQIHGNYYRHPTDPVYRTGCGDVNRGGAETTTLNCVQAAVLRAERDRDCARAELESVRCERDKLREKQLAMLRAQSDEAEKVQNRFAELNSKIQELERLNREANSLRLPNETQIVLLKEEVDDLRRQICDIHEENCMLKTANNQLKILHEQTENSMLDYQSRLKIAERQLDKADLRLNTLDSNRETVRSEATQLRNEINALRNTYSSLEREKDSILDQLDRKTERNCELEVELKSCREKRDAFEQRVIDLEERLSKLNRQNRDRSQELSETQSEVKVLRNQVDALRKSRDEAIAENGGLVNSCSDTHASNYQLKKDLDTQIKENEALKKKICQYVQEIRRTEELLLRKEKEREEMLEQYRSLSQDTVALQGNKHCLEEEAEEYKRQVADFEEQIRTLKKDIKKKNEIIDEMETKITLLTERNLGLQHRLEEIQEEKHLIKLDLTSRTELCTRLEDERIKLKAEVDELNNALQAEVKQMEKNNEKRLTTERSEESTAKLLESSLHHTRLDLENQLRLGNRLNEELLRLRRQNESLMEDLEAAHRKNMHCEKLIHEYFVQNQELRHNLTDDRFRQARAREQYQKETSACSRFSRNYDVSKKTPLSSLSLAFSSSSQDRRDSSENCTHPTLHEGTSTIPVQALGDLSDRTSSSNHSSTKIPTAVKQVDAETNTNDSRDNTAERNPNTKGKNVSYQSKTM